MWARGTATVDDLYDYFFLAPFFAAAFFGAAFFGAAAFGAALAAFGADFTFGAALAVASLVRRLTALSCCTSSGVEAFSKRVR